MSASAGRSNFLIPNTNKSKDEKTSRTNVNFSLVSSVKYPIKAIGINIVIPIASILLKQKNSLKPTPVRDTKSGPTRNTHFGLTNFMQGLKENPKRVFLVGPLFVSLKGVGFKEFFCFRRIEAIGITIFIPIAFIGHLTELTDEKFTFALLVLSALLLLILGIRKFHLPAEADIGDKSVFDFLESQRKINTPDIETN